MMRRIVEAGEFIFVSALILFIAGPIIYGAGFLLWKTWVLIITGRIT